MSLYAQPLCTEQFVLSGWLPALYREHGNEFRSAVRIIELSGRTENAVRTALSHMRTAGVLEERRTFPAIYRFTNDLWETLGDETTLWPQVRDDRRAPKVLNLTDLECDILKALQPGKRFARHCTERDIQRSLRLAPHVSLGYQLDRLRSAGLVAREPWGQHQVTWCQAHSPIDEESALFVAGFARGTHNYNLTHKPDVHRTWPTVSDCEKQLGMRTGTLNRWLRNHDLLTICPRVGKTRRVPKIVFEHYLSRTVKEGYRRASRRPRGYVTLYAAMDLIQCSYSVVYRAVARGEVRAVQVGLACYYSTVDLERLTWDLKHKPLPGYELISDRCKKRGADHGACADWLRSHGYEVRQFRTPNKQLGNYALTRDLDTWQARFTGDCRRFSMTQAREIRRRCAAGESRQALGHEFGIGAASIRQIELGSTYKELEMQAVA